MSNYKKVLIFRNGAIGDVIHTSNLFRAIKKLNPEIEIHYLTGAAIKPLLENNPDLDKVIAVESKISLFSEYFNKLSADLKRENYDIVFNLQPSLKTRLLMMNAGIKKRINYKKDFKMHAVKNFWATGLKAFPTLKEEKDIKMYLPEDAKKKAAELLKNYPKPYIVINAGGVFSVRQGRTYPVEKWIELGNKIVEKFGGTIILNGAKEDEEILAPLNGIKNSVNFTGKLPLEVSCAVISEADMMISGDSGPLHIATALGVNSIGLFGSMPADRTGCYCNGINIISKKSCVPCNRRKCKYLRKTKELYAPCMKEIEPDKILAAINISRQDNELRK